MDKLKEIAEALRTLPGKIQELIDLGQEILDTLLNLF